MTQDHTTGQVDAGTEVAPQTAPHDADQLPLVVVDRDVAARRDEQPPGRLRRFFRAIRIVPLLWICVAFGGIVGLYFQPPGLKFAMRVLQLEPGGGTSSPIAVPPQPGDGGSAAAPGGGVTPLSGPDTVVGLGKLLPAGDVITVSRPSGSGDAKIARLNVTEGDRVDYDQIVAVLDNEPRLLAAIDASRATVQVREADLERARDSVRASKEEAEAALASAEATALRARLDFDRTKRLFDKGIMSKAALDAKEATAKQLQKQVERAEATLSRYLFQDIDTQSDVVVAAKNLDAARAHVETAMRNLEQAYVRAPIAGTVLEIDAHAGEKPGPEGVMDIGDIDRMTAKVEVYQSHIAAVSLGDAVEISTDALDKPLTGTVSRIGLQVKKQSVIGSDPAANTDARVVEVIVKLDDESSKTASRFTNLQVLARIKTGSSS